MDKRENWPISGINVAVTKLEILSENNGAIGYATGFFFKENEVKYLVTNKHIVESSNNYTPFQIKIKLHKSFTDYTDNNLIIVDLYQSEKVLWYSHINQMVDIAVIPLNNTTIADLDIFNNSIVNFISKENLNTEYIIPSFADVLIVGYPLSFSDEKQNLPVYRRGMIASSYPVNFNGLPYFLIDANLHRGTSGSPVLNSDSNLLINKNGAALHTAKTILLGIHSAEHIQNGEPLGLNVVWYPHLILEIVQQNT